MSAFTLKEIEDIDGKIKFFKLYRNKNSEFDEFWNEASKDKILAKELIKIQVTMQQISKMMRLPEKKFKDITPRNGDVKEYEIKTEHLRVYCFHQEKLGRIVVTGGIKSKKQQNDINRFRDIKREYFGSLDKGTVVAIIK